jgi:hypothetical protein
MIQKCVQLKSKEASMAWQQDFFLIVILLLSQTDIDTELTAQIQKKKIKATSCTS